MSKRNKKRDKIDVSESEPATHNPFAAALAGLSAPEADDADLPKEPAPVPATTSLPKVTTRIERKGRGGKTVTLVEGLGALSDAAREELARDLRKALGTGAVVEGDHLAVQGDQRERVAAWFDARRGT